MDILHCVQGEKVRSLNVDTPGISDDTQSLSGIQRASAPIQEPSAWPQRRYKELNFDTKSLSAYIKSLNGDTESIAAYNNPHQS